MSRLYTAAGRDKSEAIFLEVLRGCGDAEVKYRDSNKWTVLMWMAHHHDWPKAAAALIERGCEVNAANLNGSTALHNTGHSNHRETARVLLEHGADRMIKDVCGETAADEARKNGHAGLAAYIDGFGSGAAPAARMAALSVSSSPKTDFFISHCTTDDSHDVFTVVKTYMDAKDKTIFNPTTHLSHVEKINKEAMQGAVKKSKLVVAALSDGFFESSWCAAEIAAAKEAGIKVIPCFSGDDHAAKQIDRWVVKYKDHPEYGYIFRENARDVLNKQNPASTKATLAYLATLA